MYPSWRTHARVSDYGSFRLEVLSPGRGWSGVKIASTLGYRVRPDRQELKGWDAEHCRETDS